MAAPATAQTTGTEELAASDAPPPEATKPLDYIAVTASRRLESIQKAPVSVIALHEKEINTVADLTSISPGAVFISSGVDVDPTLIIRAQIKRYGPELPAVLTYLDEVPLPA